MVPNVITPVNPIIAIVAKYTRHPAIACQKYRMPWKKYSLTSRKAKNKKMAMSNTRISKNGGIKNGCLPKK
jgi:hypothetical protein